MSRESRIIWENGYSDRFKFDYLVTRYMYSAIFLNCSSQKISGDLVIKSKLSLYSGSVALKQLNPIHEKGPKSICNTHLINRRRI